MQHDISFAPGAAPQPLVRLLVTLVIADMVSALESSMIFAAFKSIIAETADPAGVGWLVSSFFIVAGPAAVVAGRLGDLFGRKPTLVVLLFGVLAGSVISAFSSSLAGIVVGRALQGLSGGIMPLCVGIYRTNAERGKLGLGLGVLLSAHAIGTLIGLLAGGLIVDHMAWRDVFRVSAVAAVIAVIAVAIGVPGGGNRSKEPLDWLGFGLIPPMAALLYVVSVMGKHGISPGTLAIIVAVSAGALALWSLHELRQAAPLVDLRALKQRNVALSNLIGLIVSIGPSQLGLYFALTLQQPVWSGIGFGLSASAAGLIKAPTSVVSAIIGPWTGRSADRRGPKLVLVIGAAVQLAGWLIVLAGLRSLYAMLFALFLCSGGAMVVNVALTSAVTLAAPRNKTSEVVGTLNVSKNVGNAIGAQLMGLLFSLSLVTGRDGSFPAPAAHMLVLAMMIGTSALALLLAFQVWPQDLAQAEPRALLETSPV